MGSEAKPISFSREKMMGFARSLPIQRLLPIPAAGLETIEAAPPSWTVTLALGENPREVALVDKTTELGNISELAPRIL
jgi:hypothetical protein